KHVNPIPEGFHTATPYLAVQDGAQAIDFYKRAFGAKEVMRMNGPDGKVSHAEIKIGDSIIMLSAASSAGELRTPQSLGASTVSIFLYLDNVDATFKQALSAGAKTIQPLEDMFWGDRYGRLTDPFGHSWSLAQHIEDVAPTEMEKRASEAMAKQARRAQTA
ncbi:MAG: VOC family protein, partial [Candidatus Acidiferrales bacterium]